MSELTMRTYHGVPTSRSERIVPQRPRREDATAERWWASSSRDRWAPPKSHARGLGFDPPRLHQETKRSRNDARPSLFSEAREAFRSSRGRVASREVTRAIVPQRSVHFERLWVACAVTHASHTAYRQPPGPRRNVARCTIESVVSSRQASALSRLWGAPQAVEMALKSLIIPEIGHIIKHARE